MCWWWSRSWIIIHRIRHWVTVLYHLYGCSAGDCGLGKAWVLKKYEFVRLLDSVTGAITTHRGEVSPTPYATNGRYISDRTRACHLLAACVLMRVTIK